MELIFQKKTPLGEIKMQLFNLIESGKFVPMEGLPAMYIYEGTVETKLRILHSHEKLAEEISHVLGTNNFERAVIILEEEGMIYVAFTSIEDVELPAVLTMAIGGSC